MAAVKVVDSPSAPQAGLEAREEGGKEQGGGERSFEEEDDDVVTEETGVRSLKDDRKAFFFGMFFMYLDMSVSDILGDCTPLNQTVGPCWGG